MSSYGLTAPDVISLQKLVPQTAWKSAGKKRFTIISKAISTFRKPLKKGAESRLEIFLRSEETRKSLPMVTSYSLDIIEGRGLSADEQGAERQPLCIKS